MKERLRVIKFNNKSRFALKIQKVFRGWKLRKKMKKLFQKIKYQDDDLDNMPAFDDEEFFNKKMDDFDLDLKIPNNINLLDLIAGNNNNNT